MKHTSGPWILDLRVGCMAVYSGKQENCLSEMASKSNCLFWKNGTWNDDKQMWETDPQDEANARLIAQCPKMYEYIKVKANEGDTDAAAIIATIEQ